MEVRGSDTILEGQRSGRWSKIRHKRVRVCEGERRGTRSQKPGKGPRSVQGSGVRRVEEVIGGRSAILMVRRFQSPEVTYRGQKSRR